MSRGHELFISTTEDVSPLDKLELLNDIYRKNMKHKNKHVWYLHTFFEDNILPTKYHKLTNKMPLSSSGLKSIRQNQFHLDVIHDIGKLNLCFAFGSLYQTAESVDEGEGVIKNLLG